MTDDEVKALIDSLHTISTSKIKTIRIKKINHEEQRFGIIDSGATHNVREVRDDDQLERMTPTEVQVAFERIHQGLYINEHGTVIGPKGTESIVSTHEVTKIGYEIKWEE